jgi:hypothetical protein
MGYRLVGSTGIRARQAHGLDDQLGVRSLRNGELVALPSVLNLA